MLVLSNIEQQMLARGYVSARMVAAKIGRHPVGVRKDMQEHPEAFESVRHGKWLKFFTITSVTKFYKPMFDLIDFDSWQDVVEGSAPGRMGFVQRQLSTVPAGWDDPPKVARGRHRAR